MKFKSVLVGLLATLMLIISSVTAFAQDNPPMPPEQRAGTDAILSLLNVISEETGLTSQEIIVQVQEGLTLGEIIVINGGDLDAVTAAATETITQSINDGVEAGLIPQERADQLLANLDEVINAALNGELPRPREDRRGEPRFDAVRTLVETTVEQTGIDIRSLLSALRDGQTLAEFIEANGGDLDAVLTAATEVAQAGIDEALASGRITEAQAEELAAAVPDLLEQTVNGELNVREVMGEGRPGADGNRPGILGRRGPQGDPIFGDVAELIGLTPLEIADALRDGATISELLESNGSSTEELVDLVITRQREQLESRGVDTERIEELLIEAEERLLERINNSAPPPPDGQ